MTVEIFKVKKNTYGNYMLLVKEPDGVFRCWSVGGEGKPSPCDELGAIRMFIEEWNDPQWREFKQDRAYREERGMCFDPKDFEGTGLVVFD